MSLKKPRLPTKEVSAISRKELVSKLCELITKADDGILSAVVAEIWPVSENEMARLDGIAFDNYAISILDCPPIRYKFNL